MIVGHVVAWACPTLNTDGSSDMRVFPYVFKTSEDAALYSRAQDLIEPHHLHGVYELHRSE